MRFKNPSHPGLSIPGSPCNKQRLYLCFASFFFQLVPAERSPHITWMPRNSMLMLFMLPNVSGCQTQFCSKPFNPSGTRQAWLRWGRNFREMAPTCSGKQKESKQIRSKQSSHGFSILLLPLLTLFMNIYHCVQGLLTAECSSSCRRRWANCQFSLRFRVA